MSPNLLRFRLLIFNAVLLFALLGSTGGYRTGSPKVIASDSLSRAALPFRGWTASELHLTKAEQEMLRPDAVLLRRYTAPSGETVDLAVIAGHRKQTVHTPAFCMAGGGWETLSEAEWQTAAGKNDLKGTRSVMGQQGQELVATYFFTDGASSTRSLVRFQGTQLLQRLRGQTPLGALVRITVPVARDRDAAEKLSDEFAEAVFPDVLRNLRSAPRTGRG